MRRSAGFTPYNPENPSLQSVDEGNLKSKVEGKSFPPGYTGFTPYHPERTSLQTGDEGNCKPKDEGNPRPLGLGCTGFTLMEVVVALAILGISLTVIIELFSGGLRLAKISGEYSRATHYARMKVDEIGLRQDLEEGTEEGEFDENYHWRAGVRKVDVLRMEKSESFKPLVELFEIKVDVLWKSGAKERSTQIETYRTVKVKQT